MLNVNDNYGDGKKNWNWTFFWAEGSMNEMYEKIESKREGVQQNKNKLIYHYKLANLNYQLNQFQYLKLILFKS